MIPIQISDDALEDLKEGFFFYEAQKAGLGDYFLACLREDIDELGHSAGIHRLVYRDYHRRLSKTFPYAIFYTFEQGRGDLGRDQPSEKSGVDSRTIGEITKCTDGLCASASLRETCPPFPWRAMLPHRRGRTRPSLAELKRPPDQRLAGIAALVYSRPGDDGASPSRGKASAARLTDPEISRGDAETRRLRKDQTRFRPVLLRVSASPREICPHSVTLEPWLDREAFF